MGSVSLLYCLTPLRLCLCQELFTRFFYVPVVLGGLWFGLWGGLRVSFFVTLICFPHAFRAYGHDQALFYDEVLEIILFNLAGAAVGFFRDRDRRQKAASQRLQALASLGETVSSVAHEIKNMLIPIRESCGEFGKTLTPEPKQLRIWKSLIRSQPS
jgi:two-component system sensor histidine kinase HydH